MKPELKEKLIALFQEHPDLFENQTYRFMLDEVAEHVGDEIYD